LNSPQIALMTVICFIQYSHEVCTVGCESPSLRVFDTKTRSTIALAVHQPWTVDITKKKKGVTRLPVVCVVRNIASNCKRHLSAKQNADLIEQGGEEVGFTERTVTAAEESTTPSARPDRASTRLAIQLQEFNP
jgi:hypothetical protein